MNWLSDQRCESPRHLCRVRLPLRSVGPIATLTLGLLVLLTGCGQDESLRTDYGQRRGTAAASVNGTSVLAEMFREAGMRVTTVTQLSSGLDKYDVVVWAPDDFASPTKEVREFLETWLAATPERTLVYVGRDYDAGCEYWETMVPLAPADQQIEVMRRAAETRAAHSHDRVDLPQDECCEWFVTRRDYPGRQVNALSGPWSRGVDASGAQIWSQGRLEIPTDKELTTYWDTEPPLDYWKPQYTPLLTSGKETLAFEVNKEGWDGSRIVVVANGSFLLNLPLVNLQHRRLAGRLIDECSPCVTVAFLESRVGGPLVHGEIDPLDEDSLRSRVLLATHWVLLGTIYCFFVFPIFGRPKSIETDTVADFGQHVDAMAELLERSEDVAYAQQQLGIYRKGQRHEQSSGPAGPPPVPPVAET